MLPRSKLFLGYRPADPRGQFVQALTRTPGCPKVIGRLAQAAPATGDQAIAQQSDEEFLALSKNADPIALRSLSPTSF
jgi:hypothetical protein